MSAKPNERFVAVPRAGGEPAEATPAGGAAAPTAPGGAPLTRRRFLARSALALGGAALALGGAGCSSSSTPTQTVSDMGGREVKIPQDIERIFCSNPIGTVDMYLLEPDVLVGWNFLPSGDNRKYIPDEYLELPSLGVWMGSGSTPNDEEIAAQDPQVILCFWTADDTGCDMADEIYDEVGIPVLLVDYDIRSCSEMYRWVGGLLGLEERAEELAAYCDEKLAQIAALADAVPESQRKSIFLAQGTGGLSTDPVGSMHVTDALELMNTENVADMPGTEGQGMGMPSVNLEQIVNWDPDAVLVSEYSMSDSESSDLYNEILADEAWQVVPAVADGRVYRLPQSPFAWFGRPPSVVRLLGCLLVMKLLYPDYTAELDLVEETRAFYELFYRLELTDEELVAILETAGVDVSELEG